MLSLVGPPYGSDDNRHKIWHAELPHDCLLLLFALLLRSARDTILQLRGQGVLQARLIFIPTRIDYGWRDWAGPQPDKADFYPGRCHHNDRKGQS